MLSLANTFDNVSRWIGKTIGWIILPLIVVIMFDVVTRKIDYTRLIFAGYTAESGYSVSTILQDLQWHLHAALLMLTFGYGYLANAHVRVDIFREMLSRRAQGRLELILLFILGLPFLVMMIKYASDMFFLSYRQGEGSDSLTGIGQRWIIKAVMPIGFIVVMLAVLATMIRLWAYLWGSEEHSRAALDKLEIFADESEELEAARRKAEEALRREAEAEKLAMHHDDALDLDDKEL